MKQADVVKEKIDMGTGTTLIACGIFSHELESVLPADNGIAVHWLDAGLHADAERMKAALDQAVAGKALGRGRPTAASSDRRFGGLAVGGGGRVIRGGRGQYALESFEAACKTHFAHLVAVLAGVRAIPKKSEGPAHRE